jgi:hypothetical protein
MGDQGHALLRKTFAWMIDHDRALSGGTVLFLGALFFGRGLGGFL